VHARKGFVNENGNQQCALPGKIIKNSVQGIQIEGGKKILLKSLPKQRLARGNFSARLRMALLYYFAATNNLLVLGTADKSELMLGYFTKFGDAGADIFPIGVIQKPR
jgi:NAD+ synthase